MTESPVPARSLRAALVALAAALVAAVAWAAPGAPHRGPVASRAPSSPAAGALPLPAPGAWLPSSIVDGDRGAATGKEVVESVGVSIPSPWKPAKGAFGRPAAATEVASAAMEGTPGRAAGVGDARPERPGSAPEGVLHGPSPPDLQAS
jgi:hypothetical protein